MYDISNPLVARRRALHSTKIQTPPPANPPRDRPPLCPIFALRVRRSPLEVSTLASHGHALQYWYASGGASRLIRKDPHVCLSRSVGTSSAVKLGYRRHTAHEPCPVLSYPSVITSRTAIGNACVIALSTDDIGLQWPTPVANHLVSSIRWKRINILVAESDFSFMNGRPDVGGLDVEQRWDI